MRNKLPLFDNLWIGLSIGLVVPVVVFYLYYLAKFKDVELMAYLGSLHQYEMLFKIMSLCVLSDLPVFYLFIHFKFYKGARGMVMACFLYAFSVLAYRIFH